MNQKYADWIAAYLKTTNPYGRCKEACTTMQTVFTELVLVPGYVDTGTWGRRAHWWCVTLEGDVVDPTVSQFPGGVWYYQPYKEGDAMRLGKCMDCGTEIWGASPAHVYSTSVCDEKCERSLCNYMDGPK